MRLLEKNIENASLRWFINADGITEEDYDLYQELRERRNDVTHELNKDLIDDKVRKLAKEFNVDPIDLIGHVLEFRIQWKATF